MIVNLVVNSLEIKANSGATPEYIPLDDISGIFPIFFPAPSAGPPVVYGSGYPDHYEYPTRTELVIQLSERYAQGALKIELQKVTAGPLAAFNSGTQNDLNNAAALVNSWL